jgi:hypothetical protein
MSRAAKTAAHAAGATQGTIDIRGRRRSSAAPRASRLQCAAAPTALLAALPIIYPDIPIEASA